MFLLDDIFLAPIKGVAAICQKVREAAQDDLEQQEKAVLAALAELHQELDAHRIGDEEFDRRECQLLDRLDACRLSAGSGGSAGEEVT
ncbi:MAG: gas vesicle protein GvpG [Thermoguttaceae bacterium]|jgi:hypothetical protein